MQNAGFLMTQLKFVDCISSFDCCIPHVLMSLNFHVIMHNTDDLIRYRFGDYQGIDLFIS